MEGKLSFNDGRNFSTLNSGSIACIKFNNTILTIIPNKLIVQTS